MTSPTQHATVLIADDQEHVREALAMLLRGHGYGVVLCGSPQDAIAAAQQQQFDIALVDMNYQRDSTSGLEGLDLIERLRNFDNILPVVALTAWGNVELAVNAMKFGASDFIEKPWRNDSLLEKVRSLVAQAGNLRSSQRVSEYERQDALQLQTRLVPRRHLRMDGIEVFGESLPAGTVGGDYFGVWRIAPDALHICVADVSGKGTPGAVIAAMLYASVSTLSSSGGGPAAILSQVESILSEQLGGEHYVTIFYGVLDTRRRVLEYVNAGHCPPILAHANGSITQLDSTRPVLGLIAGQGFETCQVLLHPGDRLALYTDGITEAVDDRNEEFGSDRLKNSFALPPDSSLEEQHRALMDRVRHHSGGKFTDDATLVLLSLHDAAEERSHATMHEPASAEQSL